MTKRNPGLDLFRALAISLVIFAHLGVWVIEEIPVGAKWYHRVGWLSQTSGVLGVELFFVLSGFLVGGLALNRKTSLIYFYLRRWLRTMPAYFFILIVLLAIGPVPPKVWPYFLFLQSTMGAFFSVAWSLCIEEWFYVLLPLFLLIPRRYFIHSVILVLVASALSRVMYAMPFEEMRRCLPLRMDALLIGVTLAWIKTEKPSLYQRFYKSLPVFLIFSIIAVTLFVSAAIRIHGVYLPSLQSPFFFAFFFSAMPIVLALLIPFVETRAYIPASAIFTSISAISYSLYLVHQEIFFATRNAIFRSSNSGPFISLLLAIVAAFVLYRGVEKPFMKWRDKQWPSRN